VFEFLARFFGKPSSSATAKERLRLVLLSDHLSLAPDVVEALKRDLIEVISRYVDVDAANCDVTFQHQEKRVAMLANVPILAMRARPTSRRTPPRKPGPPAALPQPARASVAVAEPELAPPAETPATTAPRAPGRGKRRRRRPADSPAPGPATPDFSPA
jgi:cell division topological specificity factor